MGGSFDVLRSKLCYRTFCNCEIVWDGLKLYSALIKPAEVRLQLRSLLFWRDLSPKRQNEPTFLQSYATTALFTEHCRYNYKRMFGILHKRYFII